MMGFGMLFIGLFWILLIGGAVWFAAALFQTGSRQQNNAFDRAPRQILDERYARGEINREQYELMKRDLE
jgi:putative membrane protein